MEFRSALRRRATDGSLDARRVPEILKRFAADREFWPLIEVTSEVLQAAEKLVAEHPLRTLDAIRVASAATTLNASSLRCSARCLMLAVRPHDSKSEGPSVKILVTPLPRRGRVVMVDTSPATYRIVGEKD